MKKIVNLAYSKNAGRPDSNYSPCDLTVKADFVRHCQQGKETEYLALTTTKYGTNTPLFSAISSHSQLSQVIRERSKGLGLEAGRISYLSISRQAHSTASTQSIVVDNNIFYGRWKNISDDDLKKIARHLIEKGYDAATIPESKPNIKTNDIKKTLSNNQQLRINTKAYIAKLPTIIQTAQRDNIRRHLGKFPVIRIKKITSNMSSYRDILLSTAKDRQDVMKYDKNYENKEETLADLADCVGATRYILGKVNYQLPRAYIKDLPRRITNDTRSSIVYTDRYDTNPGDIVFLHGKNSSDVPPNEPTHVCVSLGYNTFFHSTNYSPSTGITGAKIETMEKLEKRYDYVTP